MILRFVKRKVKVDYILADSWFITVEFIKSILTFDKSVNIIGLLKMNRIVIIDCKKFNVNKVADVYRKQTAIVKALNAITKKRKLITRA